MKFLIQKPKPLTIAQYLVIGGLISIAVSPPLANFFIALSLIATLSISTIRNQLIDFLKTKLGYACIAFIAVLFSGLLYGIESNSVIATSIWGWRKLLMLPIAAAIFMNDPNAKQNLINSFWFACSILMIYSFFTYLVPSFSGKYAAGIIVRNYTTQGIFFSIAAIIALANTLNTSIPKWQRILYGASIVFFILNISLITTGKSGYAALLIAITTFLFTFLKQFSIAKKATISLLGLFIVFGILLNIQTSNNKINLAIQEFNTGAIETNETSVGYRLNFWKNTIEMLPNHVLLGVGTGGFKKAYANQAEGKFGALGIQTGDPHNQYLKILAENGVIGLVTFLSILIFLLKQPVTNPFRAIGMASLAAIGVTSLFNSHFSTFNEGQFIWILAGAMFATEKMNTRIKV
jgi:O-antigen ligase